MAEKSIPRRLARLEAKRRFLDWFLNQRFYQSLTEHELMTFAVTGQLPDPLPDRPSSLDSLDRKTLHRLWKEDERIFGDRSQEELEFFSTNGFCSNGENFIIRCMMAG
jgi:hypothetical protein